MAAIDKLLEQVTDPALRGRLQEEFNRALQNKKFGLVFEEHMPECTPLYGVEIKRGGSVAKNDRKKINTVYTVLKKTADTAVCRNKVTGEVEEIPLSELVAVAEFGEAIFPCLQPIDKVENAPDSDLWHTLIEADNYHALQLLEYLYTGKVDCIYIDPPYNTRDKDWKYNNDYVDSADAYKHSLWLSMMKKRLMLAKRLLKKDGALITTIDDNEYAHLQLLIDQLFPEAENVVISIQMNPGGTQGKSFSVTNEYAIITYFKDTPVYRKKHAGSDTYNLRRWGSTSNRYEGATCFYPVILDCDNNIVGFGDVLPDELHPSSQVEIRPDGQKYVWPIDIQGIEKKWRYARDTVESVQSRMFVEVSAERIEIKLRRETEPPKTVWVSGAYNAEAYGTKLVKDIIGKDKFPYPKSVYATKDCISMFVAGKPNALVLDFFAGSGTTLHAVNLLNAEDGGHRRCILVTNNEVSEAEAKLLNKQGYNPGDPEWERLGIARYVTWPRTVCSITGRDTEGRMLTGDYGVEVEDYVADEDSVILSKSTGKPLKTTVYKKTKKQLYPALAQIKKADGFAANCEYFKLGFLDRNRVSLGMQFEEILPLLWLKSGAVGKRPELQFDEEPIMLVLPENRFAVLVEEAAFSTFAKEVAAHDCIDTVYFVTNSEAAFHEMSANIGIKNTHQLYREYIDNFVIGARRDAR